MQLPGLAVRDFDDGEAEASENLEVDARIASNIGNPSDQEDRDLDAPLRQCARDHESVAAIVAAPAQQRPAAAGSGRPLYIASSAAAAGRPVFSTSTGDGIPMSSVVRRSASRIW